MLLALLATLVVAQAVSSSPVPAPTGYTPTAQTFWWDDVYPPIGHLATLSHHHLASRAQYQNLIAYPSAGKGGYWVQDYAGMLQLSPGRTMPQKGGNLTAVHRYGEDTAVMRLPDGFTANRIQFWFVPPLPGKDNIVFIVNDKCPGAPHDTVSACVVAVSDPFDVKCRGTVPPDLQEKGPSTVPATDGQVVISFVRSVFSAMALWA